jgi:hypothetical protein
MRTWCKGFIKSIRRGPLPNSMVLKSLKCESRRGRTLDFDGILLYVQRYVAIVIKCYVLKLSKEAAVGCECMFGVWFCILPNLRNCHIKKIAIIPNSLNKKTRLFIEMELSLNKN